MVVHTFESVDVDDRKVRCVPGIFDRMLCKMLHWLMDRFHVSWLK